MKHSTQNLTIFSFLSLLYVPLHSADWKGLQAKLMEQYASRPDITIHVKGMINFDSLAARQFVHKKTLSPEQQTAYDSFYTDAQTKAYNAYIEARKVATDAIKETTDRRQIALIIAESISKYIRTNSMTASYITGAAISEAFGEAFVPGFIYSSACIDAHSIACHNNPSAELYKKITALTSEKKSALEKLTTIETTSAQKERKLTLENIAMRDRLTQAERQLAQVELQAKISMLYARRQSDHDSKLPEDSKDIYNSAYQATIKKLKEAYFATRKAILPLAKKSNLNEEQRKTFLEFAIEYEYKKHVPEINLPFVTPALALISKKIIEDIIRETENKKFCYETTLLHADDYAHESGMRAIKLADPKMHREANHAKEKALREAQIKFLAVKPAYPISNPFDPYKPANDYIQAINQNPDFDYGVQAASASNYIQYIASSHAEPQGIALHGKIYKEAAFKAYLQDHPIDTANPEIALEAAQRFYDKKQAKLGNNPLAPHLAIRSAAQAIISTCCSCNNAHSIAQQVAAAKKAINAADFSITIQNLNQDYHAKKPIQLA